jgi:single-stranded-DNA-specific exonuclease
MVIAPDSSSNDYEQHKALRERGIDVLVIDHHEAEKVSENACIINNQLCDYPTKSLSGVGMVYKFCCFIDELLNVDYAENFVDLVALGLIADMMDMRDFETRHLITLGLQNIRNPFFRAMIDKQAFSLKGENTPIGIAFFVAPYVNATIRMGTHQEKIMLFESMLDFRAYERVPSTKRGARGELETRVEQSIRNCTNIKNRQTRARDSALETIEGLIHKHNLLENKILVIKLDESMSVEKTLTGLIANQLMAKYQRPVLLLNKVITSQTCLDENCKPIMVNKVSWEGSGRGYDKSKFDNLREFLNYSGLVMYAEGHANALGVGIEDILFNKFISYSNEELAAFDFNPCYKVDFIFNANNFSGKDILDIAQLKNYWGQGVDEPYIALEDVKISSKNIVLMSRDKKPTLKIMLPNGTSLIKFKSSEEEYESLTASECVTINVVGRCEANTFNGSTTPQILVEDYEITKQLNYYF